MGLHKTVFLSIYGGEALRLGDCSAFHFLWRIKWKWHYVEVGCVPRHASRIQMALGAYSTGPRKGIKGFGYSGARLDCGLPHLMNRIVEHYGPWALVTGASAGLGREFAVQLAARGLHVILVARRRERLEELAAHLVAQYRTQVLPVPLDLLQSNALEVLEAETKDLEVGLLVNNAGFGAVGRFLEQDLERLRRMVRLNCELPTIMAHHFLNRMQSRTNGGMIMVASAAAYLPTPWMSVYGATKAFDLMLGEALTEECQEKQIDVVTISPGHTATEFHAIAGVEGAVVGEAAQPQDVVNAALDALGKKASLVHGWHKQADDSGTALAAASYYRPIGKPDAKETSLKQEIPVAHKTRLYRATALRPRFFRSAFPPDLADFQERNRSLSQVRASERS